MYRDMRAIHKKLKNDEKRILRMIQYEDFTQSLKPGKIRFINKPKRVKLVR